MAWEGGGVREWRGRGGGEVTMSVAVGASHATCLAPRRVPAPQVAGTDRRSFQDNTLVDVRLFADNWYPNSNKNNIARRARCFLAFRVHLCVALSVACIRLFPRDVLRLYLGIVTRRSRLLVWGFGFCRQVVDPAIAFFWNLSWRPAHVRSQALSCFGGVSAECM